MSEEERKGGESREPSESSGGGRINRREQEIRERQDLAKRLGVIKHKIMVLSGKGGVGKSAVAASLAVMLARSGKKVGLLDIDIHGPSIPRILGLEGRPVLGGHETIVPIEFDANLKVMSIGFLLRSRDDAVVWRGPMKHGVIKQFLKDVEWGDLDYLIVDSPPGTGDEPLSIAQLIGDADGALIITTPQQLAVADVRKSIGFCRSLNLPVLGVIENMSGLACPSCGATVDVFGAGGGEAMAHDMGVPFLGRIPIDPLMVAACDSGNLLTYHSSAAPGAEAFAGILRAVEQLDVPERESLETGGGARGARGGGDSADTTSKTEQEGAPGSGDADPEEPQAERQGLRIAIPLVGGRLAQHFGHCEEFAIMDVDAAERTIIGSTSIAAPEHEPGLLPKWLRERGVTLIVAGGMGRRARGLFNEDGIEVVVGAQSEGPEEVAKAYLAGTLVTGENICDH